MFGFQERHHCPVCDGADLETRFSSRFADPPIAGFVGPYYKIDPELLSAAPYELTRCRACALIFQKYVGDDALLTELYTNWIDNPANPDEDVGTYREDINAIRLSRDAHEIMAAASYLGVKLPELRTLDYGMGWALWARIAAALGCRSHGSDISSRRMAFAAEKGVITVDDDEIAPAAFDFINTEQVFEHVPEPGALARRLVDALVPGGILKISVPSAEGAEAVIASLRDGSYAGDYQAIVPVQPLEHINSFRTATLRHLAEQVGADVVRPSYRHRFAFLRHQGTLDWSRPRKTAKEMVRPWYQFRNPSNIYMWLRKRR